MEFITWILENEDRVTAITILVVVIMVCLRVIKHIERRRIDCEAARLEDADERSVMSGRIGDLGARVDIMEKLHFQHLTSLTETKRD